MTWKRQVEEHTDQIGLEKGNAIDRDGVYKLSRNVRWIRPLALFAPKAIAIKPWN